MLNRIWTLAFAFALLASPALAHDAAQTVASGDDQTGVPGQVNDVQRTISVRMLETADGGMVFDPAIIEVDAGETLRLSFKNDGQMQHEFILGTPEELASHAAMVREMPDMAHHDPNTIRLQPGKFGEILWKFGRATEPVFACLIPGHFEAGMHGRVVVKAR